MDPEATVRTRREESRNERSERTQAATPWRFDGRYVPSPEATG